MKRTKKFAEEIHISIHFNVFRKQSNQLFQRNENLPFYH